MEKACAVMLKHVPEAHLPQPPAQRHRELPEKAASTFATSILASTVGRRASSFLGCQYVGFVMGCPTAPPVLPPYRIFFADSRHYEKIALRNNSLGLQSSDLSTPFEALAMQIMKRTTRHHPQKPCPAPEIDSTQVEWGRLSNQVPGQRERKNRMRSWSCSQS